VVARVSVTGYPLVAEPAPWGPVDTFRMANGWIAERGRSRSTSRAADACSAPAAARK
jgi:hypothetical protein